MEISELKRVLESKEIIASPIDISKELTKIKKTAVEKEEESLAKHIWCLERIYEIKRLFESAFTDLKNERFEDAWNKYERCEIEIGFLKKHFNCKQNEFDILFIEKEVEKYQELFPYDYFMSRESIESGFECSICGKKMSIREKCKHKVGEIYKGEMCFRKVTELKLIAMAIVKNPLDKFTILHSENVEYNYFLLKKLMEYIDNPYEKWNYNIIEEFFDKKKHSDYKSIGRNDLCPCGSNRKLKNCCLKKKIKHYNFTGDNIKFKENPIGITTFNTKIKK